MIYPLCRQKVTIYRRKGQSVLRQVFDNCYYQWQDCLREAEEGTRMERKFLLVIPGDVQTVFPGDRIFEGEGPQITITEWADFIPVKVAGLSEAAYATCRSSGSNICHTEAGRK